MARIIRTLLIVLIVIFHFSFFIFHLPKAFADTPCQPIYGGGKTCTTKTVMQKSEFPIMPPPTISKTPSTGPEALALFSLIPIGIAGWFLRKRAD